MAKLNVDSANIKEQSTTIICGEGNFYTSEGGLYFQDDCGNPSLVCETPDEVRNLITHLLVIFKELEDAL